MTTLRRASDQQQLVREGDRVTDLTWLRGWIGQMQPPPRAAFVRKSESDAFCVAVAAELKRASA